MQKIKQFEEYKNFDAEYSDITEEYAKLIISAFIDKQDDVSTLESVYSDVIKGDELDEDQAIMIKEGLADYLENLYEESKKIREIHEIDADTYNL